MYHFSLGVLGGVSNEKLSKEKGEVYMFFGPGTESRVEVLLIGVCRVLRWVGLFIG